MISTRLMIVFLSVLMINQVSGQSLNEQIRQAREKVFPALVHIQPIKEIFASGEKRKVQVTGSGVIFSGDGYVLTNNHVAEKARFVRCTLSSKIELDAEVVGLDPWTDLAVLKLDLAQAGLSSVPYAEFGESDRLEVGQIVLALGSPLGLARSLSMGVISSIDRYFSDVGEMISPFNLWIQTDAAINPGNSGGPLVNLDGKVIGINARAVVFGENLGFAIPINTARYVINQLLDQKEVQRSWLGIEWQEIKEYRKYKNQPGLEGVLVASVDKNSPADSAGLEPGDVITGINGNKVSAVYQEELPKLRLLVSNLPINSEIRFDVIHAGEKKSVNMTSRKQGKFSGSEFQCDEWGLSVQEITARIIRNFQMDSEKGVLISGVRRGSKADEALISRGYVLISIDGKEVTDLEDFKNTYEQILSDNGKSHMLFLKFGQRNWYAMIKGDK